MMKVLQTISNLRSSTGGPSICTHDLIEGMHLIQAPVKLLTFKCKSKNCHNLGEGKDWIIEVDNDCFSILEISNKFRKLIKNSDYSIYHCNALWKYCNHITCKIARDKQKPYIISPHGMLYPTALAIKHFKKQLFLKLWFRKDIYSATCLHATCKQEAKHCREFGYTGPIAVIPNPVVFPKHAQLATSKPLINGRKQIGFLGRLHPIKKVENVLYAMALLRDKGIAIRDTLNFQIMGKYDNAYETWLKEEVHRLGLDDCVDFVGFVSGEEKYKRLQSLWALMVPSAQENFGMIVPEALICGTPVYASLGTPWSELKEYDVGWWESNSPENIAIIIHKIIDMEESQCLAMGSDGRKLIEEKYEQKKVASMMYDLYRWIVGEISKPEFVYENADI